MSPYREPAAPSCAHRWATFWLPFGSGIALCACYRCGAPVTGWRNVLWSLGLWDPKGPHFMGRPRAVDAALLPSILTESDS